MLPRSNYSKLKVSFGTSAAARKDDGEKPQSSRSNHSLKGHSRHAKKEPRPKTYFFRSQPMSKCNIMMRIETALFCMLEMGRLQLVHFISDDTADDIESTQDKPFYVDVKRCNTLLKMLNSIEAQMKEFKIEPVFYPDVETDFPPEPNSLSQYEADIYEVDAELSQLLYNMEALRSEKEFQEEKAKTLAVMQNYLNKERVDNFLAWSDSFIAELMSNEFRDHQDKKLGLYLGTIATEKFKPFERVVYRLFRGNYFMKNEQIVVHKYTPIGEQEEPRTVFILFYIGDTMKDRLMKLFNGYQVHLFDCPEGGTERQEHLSDAQEQEKDISDVIARSDEQRKKILNLIAPDVNIWRYNIKKMMASFVQMNKMNVIMGGRYLITSCWIPRDNVKEVRNAIRKAATDVGEIYPPLITEVRFTMKDHPPTRFTLNSFTKGFQNLIDAYGLASYREINPTPYTVITFPFLFAVMFGDIGHGLIMAIFALVLIKKNKKHEYLQRISESPSEIANIIFGGRYIILMMGIFSVYTGFIYNDMFSKPLNILGSHWYVQKADWKKSAVDLNPESTTNYAGDPYYFGMDPVWKISGDDSIIMFNSVKMKLAIIIGVVHMIFGLILSSCNHIFFSSYVDLLLVTLPQLIIFCSMFLYLAGLIFFKWSVFGGLNGPPHNTACAPSILIAFIDMFLMKQSVDPYEGCEKTLYDHQLIVQLVLIGCIVLSMPILIAGKPIYFHIRKCEIRKLQEEEKRLRASRNTIVSMRKSLIYKIEYSGPGKRKREKLTDAMSIEDYDMMEIWIHSGIHAIDSVLGAISHTASYLRLWALSLAHEQLSHVLWMMVLKRGFGNEYYYSAMLFLTFAVWAILTVAVLVTMEALSAFLHTLRLHWVEFQSKFYTGAGYPFIAFKFDPAKKYG